ncbi:hypothetical protein PhCBS80983_g04797 [Powellomyces hirtus]|uniref:C2 domain-containing protein n=1 Tax=Powellomyces hirtus TaxID=109895 RepID=A0A507DZ31_9FUNG|nr:hypothetical protein PhCBS80983_g04797 [Powellomyces hirtus]
MAAATNAQHEPLPTADPYVLDSADIDTPPVTPPVEVVSTIEAVPRNALDKLKRIVEDGAPEFSVNIVENENVPAVTVTKKLGVKPSMDRLDSFRTAGKTVLAVNAMARKEGEKVVPKSTISAAQAATRLTGLIFDNDGEIPAVLHSVAIKSVEHLDRMKSQVNPYKGMIEQIIYWENLKIALYFTTGIFWTWFLTKIGFGFAWVLLILVMVGGAFRRNQQRLRRKINNELNKQHAIKKLETDSETVEWMNLFLSRFWLIFEPSLSEGIKLNDDLRLTTFTLGSQAPRVESIRCYPSTNDDILMMDWDLGFSPVDEDSMSKQERKTSDIRNSKIELTARVGKGVASIPLPVLVTEMEFRGKARIQLKFMTAFPHIKTVEFCLLDKPVIDFNVRPLKGMDLMDTPGLSNFISDTIDYYTTLFVVDPNKITIDLEQLLGSTTEADKPVGVLRVSLYEAKGLRNMELAGKSDPYALMTIGGKQVVRTKTIDNSLNPVWEETHHIIITKSTLAHLESKSDELKVEVLDWNNLQKDKSLGTTAPLKLSKWVRLLDDGSSKAEDDDEKPQNETEKEKEKEKDALPPLTAEEHDTLLHEWGSPFPDDTDIWKKLALDNSPKGEVRMGLAYFPVQEIAPGSALTDFSAGILMITVHQAKELGCSKHASPDCSIEQDGMEIFRTAPKRKTNNPVWDAPYTIFVTDLEEAKFRFRVWNDGKGLGACDIYPKDCIGKEATADWFKLSGGKDAVGRLRVTFRFTPVDLEGEGLDKSKIKRRTPVALLRLNVVEAKGLANVEMMGKSDPYTKLNLAGRSFGATHVKNNVLDPKWNEIFYAVCYSKREMLSLSVWDWNDFKKDRTLGKVDFVVADLIKEEEDQTTLELGSNPELDQIGLSKEAWAKQERDGLKVTRTGMYADVWAPIYIQKGGDEVVAAKETETTEPPAAGSKRGFPKVISMEGLSGVARGSTNKEPRQKGFLHFELDYFPVVSAQVLHAERAATIKKSRSGALPVIDDQDLDDDMRRELEQKAEEERQKEAEERQAVIDHAHERAQHVAAVMRAYPSGIVTIRLHEVQGLKKVVNAYAEILLDDEPVWTTRTKRKTLRPTWDESIDKYISNVPQNRFTLRIRDQNDKENRSLQDPVVGSWSGDFVAELMGKASAWVPIQADNGADVARMRVSVSFAPVAVEGDGTEASGGMGMLHVDILEAINVEAVDSSGASDPYCQVYLNGAKVHKTKVVKKSVNPVWNETLSVPVTSRLRSTLEIRVKDWNNFAKDVTLGAVHVQLATLTPNAVIDRECHLEGAARGTLKLRLFFDPQAIDHTKTNGNGAGTFSGLKSSDVHHDASSRLGGEEGGMTKMGKAVFGKLAGTTIGIGKTVEDVGRTATRTAGLQHPKTGTGAAALTVADIARAQGVVIPPPGSNGDATSDHGMSSAPVSPLMLRSRTPSVLMPTLSGTVTLTIVEARNLKAADSSGTSDPFVKILQMHHGKLKTMHKTHVVKKTLSPKYRDERVTLHTPPSQIRIVVKDHNTLHKDTALGEVDVELAEWFPHPQPTTMDDSALAQTVDKWIPLAMGGTGDVHVLAEYRHSTSPQSTSAQSINVASSRDSVASNATQSNARTVTPAAAHAPTTTPTSGTTTATDHYPNTYPLPPPPPHDSAGVAGAQHQQQPHGSSPGAMKRSMSIISGFKNLRKSRENIAALAGANGVSS